MNQYIQQEIVQVMPLAYGLGTFVSSASFVQPNPVQGATGNTIGGYITLAGLQNIPCMNAPERTGSAGSSSDEKRSVENIQAKRGRHVLLNGYFPALDTGFESGAGLGYQVSITDQNGTASMYTFLGGEGDSQQTQTRCKLELVTV